jgi:hypothetical protein
MRSEAFAPTAEGEGRLLLLIAAFSQGDHTLQGRTKLAKLDFLLRYPRFFERAMEVRGRPVETDPESEPVIEQRMIRYRYGPWDPSYYAILGALIGRGLITTIPESRYLGLSATEEGSKLAAELGANPYWCELATRVRILRTEFGEQTGTYLKNFIYDHFPEVSDKSWGAKL